MDFGVVSLEGLTCPESGIFYQAVSEPEATKSKSYGSGFPKQGRSESGEEEWKNSKMSRTDGLDTSKSMFGSSLLRSNSLLSGGDVGQHNNMLSFSSPKSEVTFLSKNGGLVGKTTQNPSIPFYQQTPYVFTRNAGYGFGGFNESIPGIRGPFTPSQWIELEHQALIYKYIMANVPVPSNLLFALKTCLNPYGLSGLLSGSYAPNSFGWGSFHLGFSGSTDPELGRCRRTDGKKWRCSRDAVPDQKYCERHINRGRHRSRKHVEGQTGHAVSGSTIPKVAPIASSMPASVMSSGGASNSLNGTQHQFKSLQPGAANHTTDPLVNRTQDPQGLSVISPTINLKSNDSPFSLPKHVPLDKSSQSEFGLVSSDSLLNPSQRSHNSFLDFNDKHPLRQIVDDQSKDQYRRSTIAWPEKLKSDWTQLSMSIPMTASNFSSTTSSSSQEKRALSPPRLSCEYDQIQMGLGVGNDLSKPTEKEINFIPIAWGSSVGGPLGEVLNNSSSTGEACKNSSTLNLMTGVWDSSPQLGSSPIGVLQKMTFISLSNGSSASSLTVDKKANEGGGLCDDVLGSTLASSFSIPSLQ